MERFVVLALVGLAAQLVDGAVGMAYGLSSASLLVAAGFAPAMVSASVHAAELATTLASGVSHWRFGNTDFRTARLLAAPGAVGAFLGATVLASVDGALARPVIAAALLLLGVSVFVRFTWVGAPHAGLGRLSPRFLAPLGFIAGFFDASGGGGWGPITTPVLLARSESARRVVGSVDTSEFAVSAAATLGFAMTLGFGALDLLWVAALVTGGLVAAPLAAWLVGRVPQQLLGVLIAGVIVLTNGHTLLGTFNATAEVAVAAYGTVGLAWLGALSVVMRRTARTERVPERAVTLRGR